MVNVRENMNATKWSACIIVTILLYCTSTAAASASIASQGNWTRVLRSSKKDANFVTTKTKCIRQTLVYSVH